MDWPYRRDHFRSAFNEFKNSAQLVPYKGTEFNLKGLPGVGIEFRLDESGKAVEASFKQPNGAVTFKRK
ncbi:MAG: hypothetical protein QHH14_12515 [Clostridiales bacterium]|nr:hypothetical protein [Clostridiales bacterium]